MSPPLSPLAPVLVGGLFGLGAALLLVGVLTGDFAALAIGAVVVMVALRMRQRMSQQSGAAGGAGDDGGEGETAADAPRTAAADGDAEAEAPDGDVDARDDREAAHVSGEGDAPAVGSDGFVVEAGEDATTVADDGETLHGSGYGLRQATTGESVDGERLKLSRDGAQVIPLTIVSDQEDELQVDEFAPGQPVVLVPYRSPEGRVDGIRVFDEVIDHLAGWLPERVAKELAGELRRGTLPARSLYEWRDGAGRRRGLSVLVHHPDTIVQD